MIDCPQLAASHPALTKDTNATTATGPSFDRVAPPGQLIQVVIVMPTEDDAQGALAAFEDAVDCIKSLLGRQKGAAPATAKRLDVTKWAVPPMGDGSATFDLAATIADETGERSFHLSVAVVQVGRAIDFVAIFATDPLSESDATALSGSPGVSVGGLRGHRPGRGVSIPLLGGHLV